MSRRRIEMFQYRQVLVRLRTWALEVQDRTNHNKATCALANKLARIAWAAWVKHESFQAAPAA